MTTFTKAVAAFKKSAAEWLTDDDLPAVVALEAAATQLDKEVTAALLNSYGVTYRNLLTRKPKGDDKPDELAQLLAEAAEDDSASS